MGYRTTIVWNLLSKDTSLGQDVWRGQSSQKGKIQLRIENYYFMDAPKPPNHALHQLLFLQRFHENVFLAWSE